MTNGPNQERVDSIRRKLLRTSAVIGGGLALGHLPYQRPAVKSFFGVRSAWAQPSVLATCGTAVLTAGPPPPAGGKTASFTIENTGPVPFSVNKIKSSNPDFTVLNPTVLPKLEPKEKVQVDMVITCETGGIQSTTVSVETSSSNGPADCPSVDLSVDCGSD